MTEEADMRAPHVGRMMVAVAVVTVAALVQTTILTEAAWSGHASIPLEFLIRHTGRTIPFGPGPSVDCDSPGAVPLKV